MAKYDRIGEVREDAISLKRQDRIDLPDRHHLCSWRETRQHSVGSNNRPSNRRFYLEQGEWWNLRADQALRLLKRAADEGLLNDAPQDPSSIVRCDAVSPDDADYQQRMGLFLVGAYGGNDPDQPWRKSTGVICYQKCG